MKTHVVPFLATVCILVSHVPVIAADIVFYPATKTSPAASASINTSDASGVQALITIDPYYSQAGDIKGGGNISGSGFVCSFVDGGSPDGTCSQYLTVGTQITLAAAPDANSIFYGWSGGACSDGLCTFTVQGNTIVNAYFAASYRIMDEAGNGYNSITEALSGTGTAIRVRQRFNPSTLAPEDYTENLTIDRPVEITGGYTATFEEPASLMTTVQGVVTVGNGTLTVGGIIIK